MMIFRLGQVYKDKTSGADFIIALERLNEETHEMSIRFINLTNYIMLPVVLGKQFPGGEINCASLNSDNFELVAGTLKEYYRPKVK